MLNEPSGKDTFVFNKRNKKMLLQEILIQLNGKDKHNAMMLTILDIFL